MDRPRSLWVVVVGWFFLGGLAMLHSMIGFVNLIQLQLQQVRSPMPAGVGSWIGYLVIGGYALMLTEAAVGVLALASAYYLFQLRAWARTSLTILSWLGLLVYGAFTAWVAYSWMPLMLGSSGALPWRMLLAFSTPLILCLVMIACFLVSILFLRGRAVRNVVQRATVEALLAT